MIGNAQNPGSDQVATSDTEQYQAATEGIRAASRWLATAFAGVGGALIAGVPLTALGHLDLGSVGFWRAVTSLVVALIAIGFMVFSISSVFTARFVSFAAFSLGNFPTSTRRWRWLRRPEVLKEVRDSMDASRDELYGASAASLAELNKKLRLENERLRQGPPGEKQEDSDALQGTVARVLAFANYEFTRRTFRALLRRLGVAGTVVAVSIIVYAFEVGHAPPTPVAVSKPIAVKLVLKGKKAQAKLGSKCDLEAVFGVAVAGRLRSPEVVTDGSNGCAAVRLKVTSRTGVAIPLRSLPKPK